MKSRPLSSNLVGRKFGRLTVIEKDTEDYVYPGSGKHEARWICECDCKDHNKISVVQHNLFNGHTHSCGCDSKNKIKDITGQKFGKLTVIKRAEDFVGTSGKKEVQWLCKCDCGKEVVVRGHNLRNGHTTSCGCAQVEASKKHGFHGTKLYSILMGMRRRCYNENVTSYKDYGGRGITICDEWMDPNTGVEAFCTWALANGYSDDLTIDRIDNSKGYSPENCRWTTPEVQANNRRSNITVEYNGETHTITDWAKITGINAPALFVRYNNGWTPEAMFTTPLNSYVLTITNSNGESHTLSEWSQIVGIDAETIYERIHRRGWEVDRALYTPIRQINRNCITYNGDTYSYAQWNVARGYADSTIENRLANGWTKEEALNGKPRVSKESIKLVFYVDDNNNPITDEEYQRLHPENF